MDAKSKRLKSSSSIVSFIKCIIRLYIFIFGLVLDYGGGIDLIKLYCDLPKVGQISRKPLRFQELKPARP